MAGTDTLVYPCFLQPRYHLQSDNINPTLQGPGSCSITTRSRFPILRILPPLLGLPAGSLLAQTRLAPRPKSSTAPCRKMGSSLPKGNRAQWAARNSNLHNSSPDAPSYKRSLLLAEVRNIYNLSNRLLFHDRAAVYQAMSLEERLHSTTFQLKRWIKFVTPILKISIQQAKERPPGNTDIRDFFSLPRNPEDTFL